MRYVLRIGRRHAVAVDHRVPRPLRRVGHGSGLVDDWSATGDQPLVVEERAAVSAGEEAVGDDVVRSARRVQVAVDRQPCGVVVPHAESDGVRAGDVAVLAAAVALELLLVEPVDQVTGASTRQALTVQGAVRLLGARDRTGRVGRFDVVVDRERPVAEGAADVVPAVGAGDQQRRRRQVDVDLRQAAVPRTVLGPLNGVPAIGLGQSLHPLTADPPPAAVQVVEAVVLLEQHHQVLVAPRQPRLIPRAVLPAGRS